MAALLVAMSIMAILMTVVMPVWKQTAQREKEAELIFRGQQYVHAIGLYQRKSGPGVYPPSLDVLVEQHYLRKKYKDPITGQDFQPLPAVQATPVAPGQTGQPGAAGRGSQVPAPPTASTATQTAGGTIVGGVAGVASKSTDASIRIYNGGTHYNEWQFRFVAQTQAPGAPGGPGRGAPTSRGAQPFGPRGITIPAGR